MTTARATRTVDEDVLVPTNEDDGTCESTRSLSRKHGLIGHNSQLNQYSSVYTVTRVYSNKGDNKTVRPGQARACYRFSVVQVLIVFHASVTSSTGTHKPY